MKSSYSEAFIEQALVKIFSTEDHSLNSCLISGSHYRIDWNH
jgi:hypothetical protein